MRWCDDVPAGEGALMRRLCLWRCPVLDACRAEVDSELAAGRRVVGTRAGESPRQRALRVRRAGLETGDPIEVPS